MQRYEKIAFFIIFALKGLIQMAPLFSIITICYNAASDLQRTIDSVDSQSCGLYEHIIIDGASTDSTPAVLRSAARDPRRVIVSEPDNGIYDAMNKGVGRAKGDYLIFMNAGDRFHNNNTLEIYADKIMANDYPGIVYGQTILVDRAGVKVGERHLHAPVNLSLNSFSNGMSVCHQAMAVLRRIAPLYDVSYRFSADYEWCIRCLQHSRRNVYIDDVVCDYLSEGVTTANRRASLTERFRIMCHYYGTMPTVLRHIRFAFRFMRYNHQKNKK